MNNLYALRRANGDIFAIEEKGRLHVPVFHSSRDAMTARAWTPGMRHFKPEILDKVIVRGLAPSDGESGVDFWVVSDPNTKLSRGRLVNNEQLALLMNAEG